MNVLNLVFPQTLLASWVALAIGIVFIFIAVIVTAYSHYMVGIIMGAIGVAILLGRYYFEKSVTF